MGSVVAASRLVVVPELDELEPVRRHLELRGHACGAMEVGHVPGFHVPTLDLVLALGGHGKAQLGVQTQYLIDRVAGLELVVCLGAAGSLSAAVKLGDVVVGSETIEHDYRLRFVSAPLPRHAGTAALAAAIHTSLGHGAAFHVAFGPIASGDEDIVDAARAGELRAATGALCVAWEGAGAARAAAFNGLSFIEIRCITDGADEGAAATFREHCARALPNGAEVLLGWLSR